MEVMTDNSHFQGMLTDLMNRKNSSPNMDRDTYLSLLRNICMEQCKNKDVAKKDSCYSKCVSMYDYDCSRCLSRWRAGGIPQCTFLGHYATRYGEMPK
jgi:hypothetical protein